MVEVMTPMALEVALSVQDELEARVEDVKRLRRERIERARHEADASRRRYMRVDPDNRLVADTLEADWNGKLRALAEAQEEYERQSKADEAALGPKQRERIAALATDFPAIWRATTTKHRERKRMLRLLIDDVTLVKGADAIAVHVRFRGGAARSLSLPRPVPAWKTWLTPTDVVEQVDQLLDLYTCAQIAEHLNKRGLRSGKGHRFNAKIVWTIRRTNGLKTRYERLRERGMVTAAELAVRAGVSRKTVLRWRREDVVLAHAYNDKGQYLYDIAAGIPPKNRRFKPTRAPDGLHRTEEVQCEA